MVRSYQRLAKLTRPDTAGLVLRERLFDRLDASLHSRFAWVTGPGGAGKTSLVASWIAQRGYGVVWYRVDPGDRDPATFFHFLGEAAREAGARRRRSLPHLTAEYRAGLTDFTRRYFRQFFSQLSAPCVVAFDNFDGAGSDSSLPAILAAALNEVPQGLVVVCISRGEPDEAFSRWAAYGKLLRIDADDLRLDEQEARQIASAGGDDPPFVPELLDRVRGWTAGFILTLRARKEKATPPQNGADQAPRAIFDYFAGEILAAADEVTRRFLLRTSILPVVWSSVAAELTATPHAGDLLANLERNHFFTERRSATNGEAIYEYHPLFREFLLARAAETLDPGEVATLRMRAAEVLEQRGRIESAVELRIAAADWPELIRLIREHAPGVMSHGRWQTLDAWTGAVPSTVAASQPWLLYWRGACHCMVDPSEARLHFERAHQAFRAAEDGIGTLLACAGVLEASYYQLGEQASALRWVDELDRLCAQLPALPPEVESRVVQGLLGAWMAQPQHPMLPRWARRARELIRASPHARSNAALIAFATGWYIWAGEYGQARAVLEHVALDREMIESEPLNAISACISLSCVSWQDGDHDAALEILRRARAIAEHSAVHVLDSVIAAQCVYTALSAGDAARANEELALVAALLRPGGTLEASHYRFLRAGVLLLQGQLPQALEIAQRELPVAEALAAPFMTATWQIQFAQLLALGGRLQESHEQLSAALVFARTMPSHILEFQARLTSAWTWFLGNDEQHGDDALREGLAIGRERNYLNCHPLWIPEMMTKLFSRALETGIEVDYVRRFIRKRGLSPGKHSPERWPWPVRIYTLGRFEVRREDLPVQASGKAKQRVLDLLKVIIALGHHGVSLDTVAAALWPLAEGDAGNDALRVTVHHLRKLLGAERALIVAEGRVALNPAYCWVDAAALERLSRLSADPHQAEKILPDVLRLYRGPFLSGDEDRAWLLPQRERLHSKFLRTLEGAAAQRVRSGDLEGAVDLYRRGIEVDPLAENLYRGMIDCYIRQDRRAEALEVYRHCRQMLSVVLGVPPSPETESLHALLLVARR